MGDNPLKQAHHAEQGKAVESEAEEKAAKEPMTFEQKLKLLDKRIVEDEGINIGNIDAVRSYVQAIMIDLKQQPELDAILIDRDVHNILAFIQEDRNRAIEAITEKKEKRETRSKKKSKRAASLEGVDFGDLGFGGLDEISNLDV